MMASKRPLFGGRRHGNPEDRAPLDGRAPANQSDPREAGAQRGAIYPGDPSLDIDLLDDGGRRTGGWRSGIAIVAGLAVFVGVLWYAYDWGVGQLATTRLPLIVADVTPIKSRPESPGGIEVLNQDVAVLNDVAPDPEKPQAERLLPPPEVPQPPQAAAPQVETPQATAVAEVEKLLGPPLDTAAGPPRKKIPATEQAEPPVVPLAPPQVTTTSQPEAVPEPGPPEPEAETLVAPELPVALAVTPSAPPSAPPSAATSEPAPQVAAQVAALPDAKTGGFVVQLAALRAKDGARPAWARLKKAHPALLGDRELTIQRVDLGDRGIFFRVQAGFFAERAGARDLCNALKARGQDCLVVKR